MNQTNTNVVVHVHEELDDRRIQDIERRLAMEPGVVAACVHRRARHLWVIDYDPEAIDSASLLRRVRQQGLHAALVGGL